MITVSRHKGLKVYGITIVGITSVKASSKSVSSTSKDTGSTPSHHYPQVQKLRKHRFKLSL